jgi:hypothetical protein
MDESLLCVYGSNVISSSCYTLLFGQPFRMPKKGSREHVPSLNGTDLAKYPKIVKPMTYFIRLKYYDSPE